tara:strand:- start:50 stop:880 length:831 start_codon:yes stop_codon:yes gene_type:complete
VTSNEIENEISYLKIVNKNLNNLEDEALVVYASKSILKEKIKELEVSKFYKFGMNDNIVEQNVNSLIFSKGFNNMDDFKIILAEGGLNIDYLKRKVEIELLWNNLIFEKYINKLSIDKKKIEKNLKLKIENENKQIEEYNLSEILFVPESSGSENEEINKIIESIKDIGFENAAITYSLSNTAGSGGNIGWLKETQLSKNILEKIKDLDIGQVSEVINAPTGKLILYLKDKRKVKEKISFEEELKKVLASEKNKQLNQFSAIYFKKVELNTAINEK